MRNILKKNKNTILALLPRLWRRVILKVSKAVIVWSWVTSALWRRVILKVSKAAKKSTCPREQLWRRVILKVSKA